jgi:hypothetical protein
MSVAGRTQPRPEISQPPPEPFGQVGIGRFVLPVLAAISMVFMGVSATMWYRSYVEGETLSRSKGASTYVIRSIVGRLFYYRLDFEGQPPIFINDNTNWNYSSFPIGTRMPDGWRDSWRKLIVGVEWDYAPPTAAQGVVGGFWVRVQWRTIFILSSILPMIRIVQHYRRRSIERQPGFAVDS